MTRSKSRKLGLTNDAKVSEACVFKLKPYCLKASVKQLYAVHADYPSHQWGGAGLTKFCAGMDLPPPVTKKAYNQHLINIEKQSMTNAEKLMCDAAERLKHTTSKEHPEDIHPSRDGSNIADVSVSVDGSWQKRGHSSKIGVVFVISIRTGEILDYVVKSLVCQECTAHQTWNKDGREYMDGKENHRPHCQVNHQESSESMETSGAVEIFLRSIEDGIQ